VRVKYSILLVARQQDLVWVRYFGNLSNIDDRVRNISWQTLNLTLILTLTLTLIITLTQNPNLIHTYKYTAIYVRRVAEIVYV